jgi:hypothetical protein
LVYRAVESPRETTHALAIWKKSFAEGARRVAWGSKTVLWHDPLGVWGFFGEAVRRDGSLREWNVFGEVPHAFKENMVVEINPPRSGANLNLQGVFATDTRRRRWLLHQGRMSVPERRIKQSDFAALTGLVPIPVRFANGRTREFHPIACLDGTPEQLRRDVAAFVKTCALARAQFIAPPRLAKAIRNLPTLVHSLTPEKGGTYKTAPKGPSSAKRRHAAVWEALLVELRRRDIECFNTRIKGYGPDLFTLEKPLVLFEIKTTPNPADVFAAVGQLYVYEKLLASSFKKVLVVPAGMSRTLAPALAELSVEILRYRWKTAKAVLDADGLDECLS